MAHQVVLMQSLHDDNDGSLRFVIEPREEGIIVKFVSLASERFRSGILRLQRIVDDDEVGSPPHYGASDG